MNAIAFTVYGHAAPAGSKKGFYNPKARRVIVTDDSARSRPWKAQVADAAAQATSGAAPLDGPLLLEIRFWIPRPKGHMGTGRNTGHVRSSAPWAPTVKPDLLKLARAVEDALTGVCYRDDAQIVTEILEKAYTTGQALDALVVERRAGAGRMRVEMRYRLDRGRGAWLFARFCLRHGRIRALGLALRNGLRLPPSQAEQIERRRLGAVTGNHGDEDGG